MQVSNRMEHDIVEHNTRIATFDNISNNYGKILLTYQDICLWQWKTT